MGWRDWRNWSKRRRWITTTVVLLVVLAAIGGLTGKDKKAHVTTVAKATDATTTRSMATATSTPTRKPNAARKHKPKPKPATKPKAYVRPASFFIDVTASIAGSHIQVGGTTNLPDGTVLALNAERAFKQTHDSVRIDFLGPTGPTSAKVSVHNGRFDGVLSSVEQNFAAAFKGDPGGPVATIDPDADVCVVLYTGRGGSIHGPFAQPAQVRAAIGTYGNFLRGSPGAGTFGSLTRQPSEDIVASQRVPLNPSALVRSFADQQSIAPQVARLPNVCGA